MLDPGEGQASRTAYLHGRPGRRRVRPWNSVKTENGGQFILSAVSSTPLTTIPNRTCEEVKLPALRKISETKQKTRSH